MMRAAAGMLGRAVTTAIRYSCVRTQGFVNSRTKQHLDPENKIIDYTVQRYRLFKQLALTYAMKFTGQWLIQRTMEIDSGKESLADTLFEQAATSSGLKALCTYFTWAGIEDCRKCCGGNGYLMAAGIAPLAANYVWQITAEGDYIILMLQTGRFLLKTLKDVVSGKQLPEICSYLKDLATIDLSAPQLPIGKSADDYMSLDFLLKLFRYAAAVSVATVGQDFQAKLAETSGDFDKSLNALANELCNTVRSHCFTFMFVNFIHAVAECKEPAVKDALSKLGALFAVSNMLDDTNWTGLITSSQLPFIKSALYQLMDAIRPNAVAFVDAFDFSDKVLGSAIGRNDGNVYEALLESARHSSLNKREVFDGYKEYLQPHLDLELLKHPNKIPTPSKL